MLYLAQILAFLLVIVSALPGCTSALAPEVESSRTTDSVANAATGDNAVKNPTPGQTTSPTPAASKSPEGGGGVTEGDDEEGKVLGEIGSEVTDLADFTGSSTYALSTPSSGMLTFTILTSEARDTMFRKVKSYECKPCQGAADTHCDKDGETPKSVTINFIKSYTGAQDHKVDDKGFPKGDANELTGVAMNDVKAGMTIVNSVNPMAMGNKGTLEFTAGKRPAKTGDSYDAAIDLTFGDGKHYKAHISGSVYEYPTQPTPPTCTDSQYLSATYE